MNPYFYSDTISNFLTASTNEIFGSITRNSDFADDPTQKGAWTQEIRILKNVLENEEGRIFFEYSIPRMGRRIDVVLIIKNVIFVLEFKVGEKDFNQSAFDQVWDYALDLKNFHETSHINLIAPVLIATESKKSYAIISEMPHNDNLLLPIKTNPENLRSVIDAVVKFADGENINLDTWAKGRYSPTPTIIEAAMSLYGGHRVEEITRSDAEESDLTTTTDAILKIIVDAKAEGQKAICFLTGVPGAGKTLVGLNIGAKNYKENERSSTVFLSGNGPLVAILREALTRDKVQRERAKHWLKQRAGGTERYGIVVSSQAIRLKPHAIDVKCPMDPIHWFLDGKEDIRSSYYLEDVATEFQVQGLELDWACVTWEGDFRYSPEGWKCFSFAGSKCQNINKEERKLYLKNAYRVLLTRARQGMVIVVPEGDEEDETRRKEYYDETWEYLRGLGIPML